MHTEHHGWFSPRLGRGMAIELYGHFGAPVLLFPPSSGDAREYETHGVIEALAWGLEAGRFKLFSLSSVDSETWADRSLPPLQRSRLQAAYDVYVAEEVIPFVRHHCRTPGIPINVAGASIGALHAVNAVLKHPDTVKRCFALSGQYDMRALMDGEYDEDFYFTNPVDYVPGLSDTWYHERLADCEIRLITGTGPGEDPRSTYQLSEALAARGIQHALDNWGPEGSHDWPCWQRQLGEYLARL